MTLDKNLQQRSNT